MIKREKSLNWNRRKMNAQKVARDRALASLSIFDKLIKINNDGKEK